MPQIHELTTNSSPSNASYVAVDDGATTKKATLKSIASVIYPVGAIYMSVDSTSPATLFGGTWSRINDTFLLAAGSTYSAGATGGSADAIIPNHKHSVSGVTNAISGGAHQHTMSAEWSSGSGSDSGYTKTSNRSTGTKTVPSSGSSHNHNLPAHDTDYTGVSATDKNMPPYLAVYVWKRTA